MNASNPTYSFRYRNHAEALYQALTADAFYITMERTVTGSEAAREAMLRYLDYSMVEGETYGALTFPPRGVYGGAIWSKPLDAEKTSRKEAAKKKFLAQHMGNESLRTYLAITEFMSACSAPRVPADSWYLSIAGLAPEFQGRGVGASLLEGVIAEADALGVATWLETFTPRNMSFYQRLGYRSVVSFEEPTTGSEYWLLVRDGGGV